VLLTDWDREDTRLARTAAKRAVEWDPGFARAHALLAWAYSLEGILRWSQDPEESFRKGYQAAIKAVELDYEEPWAHAALGVSELWGRREHDHGNASLRRAIELNPNNAHFRLWHSNGLCLAGRSEEGLTEIETAMRLNPNSCDAAALLRGSSTSRTIGPVNADQHELPGLICCMQRCSGATRRC
jgi:adenylate cyclase